MPSEDCLNGSVLLTKEDVLKAITIKEYIDSSFGRNISVTDFREIYTGCNKGLFEFDWREE